MTKDELLKDIQKEFEDVEKQRLHHIEKGSQLSAEFFRGRKIQIISIVNDIKKLNIEENAQDKVCNCLPSARIMDKNGNCKNCGNDLFT